MAGELKDIWSGVQNFRDKEKAGISDIVVYTEFGPTDTATESMVKSFHRNNEPNNGKPVKSEIHDASKLDHYSDQPEPLQHIEKYDGENAVEKEKSEDVSLPEKSVDESDSPSIEINKLSLEGPKSHAENGHNLESSEKIVKIQNQKNKESQHHFFPKFLSSSKEKEAKDKEKPQDEQPESKTKTKKSFNFLRRNKSSASSPTHTSSNNNININQKSDSNTEH